MGQKLLDLERDKATAQEDLAKANTELQSLEADKIARLSDLHQERDDLKAKLEDAQRELAAACLIDISLNFIFPSTELDDPDALQERAHDVLPLVGVR